MQRFTSKATSINSTKLPAVFSRATLSAQTVLDYGSGRYTEHIRKALPDILYLPYDPYNQPDDVNRSSYNAIIRCIRTGKPVDVVCSNVLNVIDDDGTIQRIADEIQWIVTRSGGTGYITIYEGDRSGIGRQTGTDQYQRNEKLRNYTRFFKNARIKNGMIVIGR